MAFQPMLGDNPYVAPPNPAAIERVHGYSLRAILQGLLVDIIATNVAAVVVSLFAAALLLQWGASPYRVPQILSQSTLLHSLLLVVGISASLLGGYVTGRIARRHLVKHAALTGLASVTLSLLLFALFPTQEPLWATVVGLSLIIPSTILGGYLALRRRNRRVVT